MTGCSGQWLAGLAGLWGTAGCLCLLLRVASLDGWVGGVFSWVAWCADWLTIVKLLAWLAGLHGWPDWFVWLDDWVLWLADWFVNFFSRDSFFGWLTFSWLSSWFVWLADWFVWLAAWFVWLADFLMSVLCYWLATLCDLLTGLCGRLTGLCGCVTGLCGWLTGLCGCVTGLCGWLTGLHVWLADWFVWLADWFVWLCDWFVWQADWFTCVAGFLIAGKLFCVAGWPVSEYHVFGNCCIPGSAVSSTLFVMGSMMNVMIVIFKSSYCHPWRGLPSWCCGLGMTFVLGRLPNSLQKNWTREGVTLYGRIAVWYYTFQNQKTSMSYNVGYLYIYGERERMLTWFYCYLGISVVAGVFVFYWCELTCIVTYFSRGLGEGVQSQCKVAVGFEAEKNGTKPCRLRVRVYTLLRMSAISKGGWRTSSWDHSFLVSQQEQQFWTSSNLAVFVCIPCPET